MKRLTILCLAATAVASFQNFAQAAGHARRTARRTTVAVAAVAATRRPTVVAAAAVVAPRPVAVAALPDLTVVDVAAEGDVLTIVVQNIGAACPASHLDVALHEGADHALVAKQTLRVLPLAVGQTMRLRLRSAPLDDVVASVRVDAAQEVTELSEVNNDREITIAPLPVPPPALEAEAVWGQAVTPEG